MFHTALSGVVRGVKTLLLLLLVLAAGWMQAAGAALSEDDFLDPAQAFVFSAATQTPDELSVHFA